MFIESLSIRKTPSYETPANTLIGEVTLSGPTGSQKILLSALALSRVFSVISQEVVERSRSNAAMVKSGMDEAIHSPLLPQSSEVPGEVL